MTKDQLLRARFATPSAPRVARGLVAIALAACACGVLAVEKTEARRLRHAVIATYPHDTAAFTQGLAYLDGKLLESTGRYGKSAVLLKDIGSGAVLARRALDHQYFGEGITVAGERLWQLTWTSGLAFVYDRQLRRTSQFRYDGQGWGLAYDGARLLMSDGSDRITFRDPRMFTATGQSLVRDGLRPVTQLNELEFARGRLYANVWRSDRVAVIEPDSGRVDAWLDLAELRTRFAPPPGWDANEHVLNGIAYNPDNGHFYVTGKCWPVLFEIRIDDGATAPPGTSP